jgi:hypothetical protein
MDSTLPQSPKSFISLAYLLISAFALLTSFAAHGQSMSDAFDKLDSDEFGQILEKARKCAAVGNFICSDKSFAAAAKLAANQRDRTALQQAITQATEKKQAATEIASEQEELSTRQAEESRSRQRQQRVADKARIKEAERADIEAERQAAQARSSAIAQILQSQARVSAELTRTNRDIAMARASDQAEQAARRRAAENERQASARERSQVKDQQIASANEQAARRLQDEERKRAATQRKAEDEARTAREQLLAQQRIEREEATRQRREVERAQREAKVVAERAAEQEGKKRYLAEMLRGVQLKASKCPDGAGHYYANGTKPRVKSEAVSCIDVHFEASCPASNAVSRGIAHNFVGMSGCFGDTYQIEPKPACSVSEVRVSVTAVQSCS